MKNIIPSVGTEIPIAEGDTVIGRDRSHICRIRYEGGAWTIVPPAVDRGLLVFIRPDPNFRIHNRIRISEIQRSGRGVYAEPVSH